MPRATKAIWSTLISSAAAAKEEVTFRAPDRRMANRTRLEQDSRANAGVPISRSRR